MAPRILALFPVLVAVAFGQAESPFVSGAWCGNVTPTSATVAIRLNAPGLRVRLQVSENASLSSPVFSSAVNTNANAGNAVKLTVQGLKPDTEYFYGLEVANVLRTEEQSRGRFRTFPLGRGSFRIAFSGDSDYLHPDQRVFDAIIAERPLLFLHLGDLHYDDTNTTNIEDYRANYDRVLTHAAQSRLFRGMPIAYTWGDHDFCGDDSDGTFTGRDTARAAYRERVPHYPLAPNAGGTVAHAFTVGRVRIIVTDTRSAAVPTGNRETASKTRLGNGQKAWFKQELINARDAGFPLILWASADPWIAPAAVGQDSWGGYATERTEIANFMRDNRISNVVIVSADMHALAFDNGTNSDYATGGGAPLTVLHAAALSRGGSVKGGPYSGGAIPGDRQYGILEIYDNGGPSVACRFLGMRAGEGLMMSHIFSSSVSGSKEHALVNISTLARLAGGDDTVVSGFVISGASERTVLVRAIGPTLTSFGVADALAHPHLVVFQGDRIVGSNTGWGATPEASVQLTGAFDRAGAFRLLDETSRDAAILLSLGPGPYTVQVRSGDGRPGAALLEVYDLP
jgi:phosphodiesterase/alkaline phosphatase D-like protein